MTDKKAAVGVLDVVGDAMDGGADEHANVFRKLDWHILPPVSLLYLLSFL